MSQKIDEVQQRIKDAVNQLVDDLDKNYLRGMQKDMFECSARCCEDKFGGRSTVDNCVEVCNAKLKRAQMNLEKELGDLQAQLSRCTMSAYDKLIQSYGPNPSLYKEDQLAKFTDSLDKGVVNCANDHIQLLPKIKERYVDFLSKSKWS